MPLALSNEKTNWIKIGLFCKRFSPPHKTFCNLKRSYQLPSHIPLPQNQICSKNQQKIDQLSYEKLADLPQLIDHKLLLPVEVEKERNEEKEKTVPPCQQSRSPSLDKPDTRNGRSQNFLQSSLPSYVTPGQ